jgi:hypothetical protein
MPLDSTDTIERLRAQLAKWRRIPGPPGSDPFAEACAEALPLLLDVTAATKKHCDADINDDATRDEAHDEMHDAIDALDKFEKARKA